MHYSSHHHHMDKKSGKVRTSKPLSSKIYLGMLFSPGAHWWIWFSKFSNCTTQGKGSPVNSCLWLTATYFSASSVSSLSLSVSMVSTFVDSICLVNSCWLSPFFSLSLLVFSFCNDCEELHPQWLWHAYHFHQAGLTVL